MHVGRVLAILPTCVYHASYLFPIFVLLPLYLLWLLHPHQLCQVA